MSKKEEQKKKDKEKLPEENIGTTSENEEASDESKNEPTELEAVKDQLLRQMAEFDNFRKRTSKEKMELGTEISSRIVSEFLPVLDNLERALSAVCSDEKYKEGIQMVYDSFKGIMEKLGVEEIGNPGDDFDPSLHQAVQHVESEEFESGKLVSVFQKGYKIGSKIIRFAMVTVAK